jgi:hypothetical protein
MLMNCRKRNFVVEIERTQIVRRVSESRIVICAECQAESDFISLRQAAALFSTDSAKLFEFIKENSSHYKPDERGIIFICLTSFIAAINNKTKNPTIKFLGEVKK